MLVIDVPDTRLFDSENNLFINVKACSIQMEHSLMSVAKWEAKWHKPFLSMKEKKTKEEIYDYLKCMTLSKNIDPYAYYCLTDSDVDKINRYLEDPMTATWFSDKSGQKKSSGVITAEVIYYQMISLQIPFECQKWHLNRLLTLIRVCSEKNAPPKKMSKNDIYSRNRALNAARRAASGSKG